MLQCQGSVGNALEATAHPEMDRASKWWHVPDGNIDALIRQLNTEPSSKLNSGTKPGASALRRVHGSSLQQPARLSSDHSVSFGAAAPEEDSLDQALRQDHEAAQRGAPAMRKGAWKVSDQAMLEFLKKKAGLNDVEEEEEQDEEQVEAKAVKSAPALIMKSVLGNNGGCLRNTQYDYGAYHQAALDSPQKSFDRQSCRDRALQQHMSQLQQGQSVVGRKGSSKNYLNPSKWDKCLSMPTLFANVGSGLDGRGNKVIKGAKFAHTPIFLQDAQDHNFERVRVAVCGHRYYNPS